MGGDHRHHHGAANRKGNRRRLAIVLGLSTAYMVAEVVGGILTNSLALLADAGHMLSDVAALALSLFAIWIAERPPTATRTYGYYRTEILAALVNGATLVAISIFIFVEAYERLRDPPEVQGFLMMAIATGGLAVNLVGLGVLHAGKDENLNVKGAWLHVLGDALGSVGAITAGLLIGLTGLNWIDAAASVLIGLLVIYSSWELLKESVAVLMESAPGHIDVDEVRNALMGIPGVRSVHDLHVWTITSGLHALSCHAVIEDGHAPRSMLHTIHDTLHDRFGLSHLTIQLEGSDFEACETTC